MYNVLNSNKIYAIYNDKTIRLYQAYDDKIADEVLRLGCFGQYFKLDRMTWIKPSFLWMMHRSGWAKKQGQNRVFAIDMDINAFKYILKKAVLSSYSQELYGDYDNWKSLLSETDVICQWDPDRDIKGIPKQLRTLQLGIRGKAIEEYVEHWIIEINEITEMVHDLKGTIDKGILNYTLLPAEKELVLL